MKLFRLGIIFIVISRFSGNYQKNHYQNFKILKFDSFFNFDIFKKISKFRYFFLNFEIFKKFSKIQCFFFNSDILMNFFKFRCFFSKYSKKNFVFHFQNCPGYAILQLCSKVPRKKMRGWALMKCRFRIKGGIFGSTIWTTTETVPCNLKATPIVIPFPKGCSVSQSAPDLLK